MADIKKPKVGRREAYQYIRGQIIHLDFPPGTALSENELGATLGVSRTPVREALLLLAEESLVEIVPQVGTFVSRVDPKQVSEAQFLREAVELSSLRSIEFPLDPGRVADLQENLAAQAKVTHDFRTFFDLDEAFHRGLMGLAGHEQSWSNVAAAKGHLDRARRLGIEQQKSIDRFAQEHREVLAAILAEDLPRAEELLRSHVRVIFDDIEAVAAASPDLFVTDKNLRPVRRSVIVWE